MRYFRYIFRFLTQTLDGTIAYDPVFIYYFVLRTDYIFVPHYMTRIQSDRTERLTDAYRT
jgi:hypothetical protein